MAVVEESVAVCGTRLAGIFRLGASACREHGLGMDKQTENSHGIAVATG